MTKAKKGFYDLDTRILTPPCLAINLHRWLPSRAREVMTSMAD